jgi:hypothetical protein
MKATIDSVTTKPRNSLQTFQHIFNKEGTNFFVFFNYLYILISILIYINIYLSTYVSISITYQSSI